MTNAKFAQTLLNSNGGYAALILRVPVGLTLAAHGAQKLFGWFGGYWLAVPSFSVGWRWCWGC